MKKVAFVLAGCGNMDGSEIHESVLSLLAIERRGIQTVIFAPDRPQRRNMNFVTKEPTHGARSCLLEAARIARGNISELANLSVADFSGLVLPGGLGAALNLTTYPEQGAQSSVHAPLDRIISAFFEKEKVVGAICIAPIIVGAAMRGRRTLTMTLGNESVSAVKALTEMGHRHVDCDVTGAYIDKENLLVSTPAYNIAKNMVELSSGIEAFGESFTGLLK